MKRIHSALAIGGAMVGAALVAGLRSRRGIDFRGCSALITGGSRGLGLLTATELGRRGAHVTLAARDERELDREQQTLASKGIDASVTVADLADSGEAEQLVQSVVNKRGRLD